MRSRRFLLRAALLLPTVRCLSNVHGHDAGHHSPNSSSNNSNNRSASDHHADGLFGGKVLSAHNSREFWNDAWATQTTPWVGAEKRQPFGRHLLLYYLQRGFLAPGSLAPPVSPLLASLALPLTVTKEMIRAKDKNTVQDGGFLTGAAEEALVREKLAGRTVMVPLCGDTRAVPYMAHQGASVVIGGDLSAEGLRLQREVNFPGVSFACREETVAGETVKVYEAELEGSGKTRVILFEGDFLSLRECPAFQQRVAGKVDLVYDRASYMALPPALRAPYVEVIAAALKTPEQSKAEGVLPAGVVVEGPVRDAGDATGPPFAFEVEELRALMEQSLARACACPLLSHDLWVGIKEGKNVPRSYKWWAVYPKN